MLLHTTIYQIKLLLDDPFHRTVPVMFILFMAEGHCLPSNAENRKRTSSPSTESPQTVGE